MDSTIAIYGIKVFGFHGVFEHEKANGQEFIIDVEIVTDISRAVKSDNVVDTIDYGMVTHEISEIVSKTRFDLIETLAFRVASDLLENPLVSEVCITVHKPHAPIDEPFDDVFVRVRLP